MYWVGLGRSLTLFAHALPWNRVNLPHSRSLSSWIPTPTTPAPPEPHQPQQRTRWVPEESAGPLSRLLFSYCNGLVRLGFQRPLEHDDLWDVARRDEAAAVSARFQGALAATADPDKFPQVSWGGWGRQRDLG